MGSLVVVVVVALIVVEEVSMTNPSRMVVDVSRVVGSASGILLAFLKCSNSFLTLLISTALIFLGRLRKMTC